MNTKIPSDAFTAYVALGPGRSYEALAKKYSVTKRAITKLAARDDWSKRLAAIDKKAREKADEKIVESLDEMNERHLVAVKFLQRKALDTLRTMPLSSAMVAVRTLSISLDKERLIRGEPTDRSAVTMEEIVRREYDRWMTNDTRGDAKHDDDDEVTDQATE